MAGKLCRLCLGAGRFFCMQDGQREWYACPACGGAGVRVLSSAPIKAKPLPKHIEARIVRRFPDLYAKGAP